jgi:hypothetical protein
MLLTFGKAYPKTNLDKFIAMLPDYVGEFCLPSAFSTLFPEPLVSIIIQYTTPSHLSLTEYDLTAINGIMDEWTKWIYHLPEIMPSSIICSALSVGDRGAQSLRSDIRGATLRDVKRIDRDGCSSVCNPTSPLGVLASSIDHDALCLGVHLSMVGEYLWSDDMDDPTHGYLLVVTVLICRLPIDQPVSDLIPYLLHLPVSPHLIHDVMLQSASTILATRFNANLSLEVGAVTAPFLHNRDLSPRLRWAAATYALWTYLCMTPRGLGIRPGYGKPISYIRSSDGDGADMVVPKTPWVHFNVYKPSTGSFLVSITRKLRPVYRRCANVVFPTV